MIIKGVRNQAPGVRRLNDLTSPSSEMSKVFAWLHCLDVLLGRKIKIAYGVKRYAAVTFVSKQVGLYRNACILYIVI